MNKNQFFGSLVISKGNFFNLIDLYVVHKYINY